MLTRIIFVRVALLLLLSPVPSGSQAAPPAATVEAGTIGCRALEAHTDDELKVTVVVFHQRDEAQRAPLAALLREHSGAIVEVRADDGAGAALAWCG